MFTTWSQVRLPTLDRDTRQAEEEDSDSTGTNSDDDANDDYVDSEDDSTQQADLKPMPARKGRPPVISQEIRAAFAADHPQSRSRNHDKDDADFFPGSEKGKATAL